MRETGMRNCFAQLATCVREFPVKHHVPQGRQQAHPQRTDAASASSCCSVWRNFVTQQPERASATAQLASPCTARAVRWSAVYAVGPAVMLGQAAQTGVVGGPSRSPAGTLRGRHLASTRKAGPHHRVAAVQGSLPGGSAAPRLAAPALSGAANVALVGLKPAAGPPW